MFDFVRNILDIKIACLGGAVVDHVRTGEDDRSLQAGGVALNMARHFRELGHEVGFFGAMGRDEGGLTFRYSVICLTPLAEAVHTLVGRLFKGCFEGTFGQPLKAGDGLICKGEGLFSDAFKNT